MIRDILSGKTLLRVLMHRAIKGMRLEGVVVDVGGGSNPEYRRLFVSVPGTSVHTVDARVIPGGVVADVEKDPLPFPDASAQYVLMFNVLEHIYNHTFVLREARRVLFDSGHLVGFVPFLINYHPDPHDYFRYTGEALKRLLSDAGFKEVDIREIGGGPFAVNYNNLMLSVPRFIRVLLLPWYLALDWVFLKLRPTARRRFPLGYLFQAAR